MNNYDKIVIITSLSCGFTSILGTEVILFATYFWTLFHTTCYSCVLIMDGLWLSDQCILTIWNSVLLGLCGLSLGYVSIIRSSTLLYILIDSILCTDSVMFLVLQVKEYLYLCYYWNESIYSCMFLLICGLHLSHVMVGIYLVGYYLYTSCYSRSVLMFLWYQLRVSPHYIYMFILLLYWHLVELFWIIISLVLYV